MAGRTALHALLAALLPAVIDGRCGVIGSDEADAAGWSSTGAGAQERCYKLFGERYGTPSTSWSDCVAACQSHAYDGRTATVASVPDVGTMTFIAELAQQTDDNRHDAPRGRGEEYEHDEMHMIWIGYTSLESPGEAWRWAADGERDPRVEGADSPRADGMIDSPWGGSSETWVGEKGSCEATRMCMSVYLGYDDDLVAEPAQCDGGGSVQSCLCEFSAVSAVGAAFNTTDGSDDSCHSDDEMCSSWGNDCYAHIHDDESPTCFNGYTAERVAGNCPEETDYRDEHRDVEACFDYRCCHPGHTLTETMRAANAAVHDYDDGKPRDPGACDWERYWHIYFIAYLSFYGVIGCSFFAGFLIACKCCATKQLFTTPLHGCCADLGGCCLTCWCPCFTWGKIATFALDMPGDCIGCLVYCCCQNLACCLGMVGRAELRKKLNIDGDCCQDCCIHCCAHSCALCQEAREVDLVQSGQRPMGAPPVHMQMQPIGQMAQPQMGVAVQATAVAIPMPAGSLVQNVAPGGKEGGGGGGGPQVISVQAQVVGAPYVQGTVPTAAVAPVMPVATADGFFNLEGGTTRQGP